MYNIKHGEAQQAWAGPAFFKILAGKLTRISIIACITRCLFYAV